MKRTYNAPTLEAKEYAQLENVFTYCDKVPNNSPVCYDQTGTGYEENNAGSSDASAHKALGPPPTDPTDPTVPTYGSVGDLG